MAAAQGAAWVAVSVESSRTLAPEARRRLEQNLALARELGAEVVVTHDDNVAKALVRIALQHNATQIVIGKSRTPRLLDWLRGGSLVNRLLRRCGTIDLYVVPAERAAEQTSLHLEWLPPEDSPAREYLDVLLALATLTLASWFLAPHTGYLFIGLLYLLAVVALGLRVGRLPVFVAGVASALTWNFVFIPPVFTFAIAKFEDGMMFATYFAVALITGHRHADLSHRRRGSGPRARLPHRRRSRSRPAARDARQPLQKIPTRRRRARWWIGTRPFDHPRLRCRPRRRISSLEKTPEAVPSLPFTCPTLRMVKCPKNDPRRRQTRSPHHPTTRCKSAAYCASRSRPAATGCAKLKTARSASTKPPCNAPTPSSLTSACPI